MTPKMEMRRLTEPVGTSVAAIKLVVCEECAIPEVGLSKKWQKTFPGGTGGHFID